MSNVAKLHPEKPEPLANVEAEANLLGALMFENELVASVSRALEPEHFSEALHGRIFAAIVEKCKSGAQANPATLHMIFKEDVDIAQVGGISYLAELYNLDYGLLGAIDIAQEIRELSARRTLRDAMQAALDGSTDTTQNLGQIADAAGEALRSIPRIGFEKPLPGICDLIEWNATKAPYREFIIPGWIATGSCGLLSGQEGVGKSLIAQQMATCAAAGLPFLGLEIEHCKALYITCEDPADELWRRQQDINAALGVDMAVLRERLLPVSLKGELGNEFGVFDSEGRLQISSRYRQVERLARDFGARLVFLDNAAHIFPGNENARHDVAVFLGLLERLSEAIDGAVILLAHPNKQHSQGNKQGNEYSGSTGWSAHVRNRLFIDWADKDAEGNFLGDDGRVLRKSKANYGKKGEEIHFRWHEWAFVKDEDLPSSTLEEVREIGRATFENECFLACLRQRNSERRAVSEKGGMNFAPKVFATMPEARGCDRDQLSAAMDRLFRLGTIKRDFLWRDTAEGRDIFGIMEVSGDDE